MSKFSASSILNQKALTIIAPITLLLVGYIAFKFVNVSLDKQYQNYRESISTAEYGMQEAMQNVSPEQMREAMQQAQFNEEQFRQSIERTMNLLKRIQI